MFGVAADHVSRRALASLGAAGYGTGLLLFAVGRSFAALVVAVVLMGVLGDALVRSTEVALADVVGADGLDRALARQNLYATVGDILGPLLLFGCIATGAGWRTAFAIAGAAMLGYAALLARLPFPAPPHHHERVRPGAGVMAALRDGRVWAFGLLLAAIALFDEPFYAFLIAALERERGLTPAVTVLVAGLGSLGAVAGAVLAERRPPPTSRATAALLAAVAVIVAVPSGAAAAVAAPVVGATTVVLWVRLQASVLGLRPGQAGTTMAVVSSIAVAGDLFPLVVGRIADRAGLTAALTCYLVAAVALALATGTLRARWGGGSRSERS